ncbi:MAG: hypothetical protein GEU74_11080 [Nitriliruptorales bacterium]|nr:hypothetical protein [Nitriliruptorales bacterium]
MARTTARPSDIYRLPEHARPVPPRAAPPEPPQRSRFPGWMRAAGAVAAVLVVVGIVRGSNIATTGDAQLVDVVSEDHATAALTLYGAQASTIEQLREREDIYGNPGPGATSAIAAEGIRQSQRALNDAREVAGADPLAAGYWNSAAHSEVIEDLRGLREQAELIALLTATHDTLYSGAGSIPLPEARDRLNGAFSDSSQPTPMRQWADALLEEMEERDRVSEATQAREATGDLWRFEVKKVEPAADRLLHHYVARLSPATINGLRGHPVAGPALELLERDRGPVP